MAKYHVNEHVIVDSSDQDFSGEVIILEISSEPSYFGEYLYTVQSVKDKEFVFDIKESLLSKLPK